MVEDKGTPRVKWRLGLVLSLRKSSDGFVRGCRVKVSDGRKNSIVLQRPINQLSYFEVSSIEKEDEPPAKKEPLQESSNTQVPHPKCNAAVAGEKIGRSNNQI